MSDRLRFLKSIGVKLLGGGVVGIILVGVAKGLSFPPVFQAMFFIYGMLGAAVYILLDAPALRPLSGLPALMALVAFYVIISGVYITGASLLPQYDPEDEKGKIDKLLKAKRAATEQGKAEELLARTKALSEKAEAIMQRLQALGGSAIAVAPPGADSAKPSGMPSTASADLVALGKEQWELQECYNCHKLFGQGGKKRGPEMDNIGNMMSPEQMREKILDPMSWMTEGFEKEFRKKKMPDKYKELMDEKEIMAVVAYLSTLKDPSVNTPKSVKPN
ncbi:MAG: c-type cytochrome [Nitrospirae bacterium]|nr:c-type cytochrome [Nitrospirota bacterium]